MTRRGQSLVEATLVLLVFFAFLFGTLDCGQVMYAHQALQERVRSAARYGTLHPFDGTGDQVANLILYDQLTPSAQPAFLGLRRENVQVRLEPVNQLLSVAIVNYRPQFFSPWFSNAMVSPRPVMIAAPMEYRGQ
jgi:hypothetical protein